MEAGEVAWCQPPPFSVQGSPSHTALCIKHTWCALNNLTFAARGIILPVMPTQISGHIIPPVNFNLEDILAVSRDFKHGFVVDLITRSHIAAEPHEHERLEAFAREHFFPGKDGDLWINPQPLIAAYGHPGEVVVDAGHGSLGFCVLKLDLEALVERAGLTLVSPNAYVRLSVATELTADMIFFGIGECAGVADWHHPYLRDELIRAGWITFRSTTLLNPVKFATREGAVVTDGAGTRRLLTGFDKAGLAAIDALPWQTRGDHQINPLALKNVEPYRNLISPRIVELSRELMAA